MQIRFFKAQIKKPLLIMLQNKRYKIDITK